MKVLFLTNIPSPYRVEFFNELGKQCELTVLYELKQAKDRDAKWNAYEAKHFREKYGLQDKYILLGVANVWDRRKGLNYFTELAKLLDDTYQIILVGVTEKQKQALPQNIIELTRTSNVNELVEIYGTADVFINPTLEDNFPTTNLEALACGTPVITFHTGGSVESIDESCGIEVEKGNVIELIKAIESMKHNKLSLKDCVKRSKMFDKNDRYNDYIMTYFEHYRSEKNHYEIGVK
jgi:putative colanic acid biosynthesis glycosyltransferase